MCNVDDQGRCAKHNFVQVKRLSRTGEWKSLLEACPLCVMDTPGANGGNSTALVPVATSSSSDEQRRSFRVSFSQETLGLEVRKDYQFKLPSSSSLPCIDSSDRSIVSVGSTTSAQRSALKSPKYKACPKKMKEQSNLEVTTMSMDLDIHEDSDSEDESPRQQQMPPPPNKPKRMPPPPPRRESRHKEQKSKINPRLIGKSPVRSSIKRCINSSVNSRSSEEQARTYPSEFNHNALVCPTINASQEDQFASGAGPFIMTRDVSDDVSAISFMGSVFSNQPNNFNALVPFQEEDEESEANDIDFDNDDGEETICTSTNNYDSKGRCVRHPHVRLRKKKFLGRGWKVLMSACPDCCVDELRRLHAKKKAIDVQKPTKKAMMPRNSIKDKDSDDTASLSSSSQGSGNAKQLSVVKKSSQDGIFVKNMAWTDTKGRRGSYTGEVDHQFIPNGKGSMLYEDSKVKEGEWKDGGRKSSGRSGRSKASERSARSRSVSVRPGARSRSTSVTPRTRARSSSRARVAPEF